MTPSTQEIACLLTHDSSHDSNLSIHHRGDNASEAEGGEAARSSIAVGYDPVDRLLYWTDQFSGIHRAGLGGKGAEGVIVKEVSLSTT